MRRPIALLAAVAAGCLGAPAVQAAPPSPFGHACAPKGTVLFCPTTSDAQRVPSWDGLPLDVDVTLPATGDGPFPTIVMLHGWGGSKSAFQSSGAPTAFRDVHFASRGFAVVTYSARGYGRSCGAPSSRTSPGCDRGWIHLADHRYEVRDTQHLIGLLVDQGVTRADAIGVTGVSYGGIQALSLARLRNRVRMEDGSFAPWRSPNGAPLSIAAAYPRWAASDLTYALQPNGRFLDFRSPGGNQSIRPGGVMKKSYNDGLFLLGASTGFYAPPGGAFNSDITTWKALADRGEPTRPALPVGRELTRFHSWAGLTGPSPPLLVQNGWTDDLFPATEALRVYRTFTAAPGARISLQLGDLGHMRGQNKARADRAFLAEADRFFDAYLAGRRVRPPAHGSVRAFTQTCPGTARPDGPFRAENWERLHPRTVTRVVRRPQRIRSGAGNPATAAALDPVTGPGACVRLPARHDRGTAQVRRRFARPFMLLGLPTIEANVRTRGRGGFVAARLWDVHRGRQTLVSRGVYRLRDDQRGRVLFQLYGNGWRFRRGHVARLELLGRDPNFLRTSNFRFSVRVSRIRMDLPGR